MPPFFRTSGLILVITTLLAAGSSAAASQGPDGPIAADAAADYSQARRHLANHRANQALDLAQKLPEFSRADWRRLDLLAESAMAAGRPDLARQPLSELRNDAPTLSERFESGLSLVELALLGSDVDRADDGLAWLDARADKLDDEIRRDADRRYLKARYHRARHDLALARGKAEQARDIARRLRIDFPAEEATRSGGLAPTDDLDAEQRFRRAKSLFAAWQYRRARRMFEELKDHPDHGVEARWHLAQIGLDKLRDRVEQAQSLLDGLSDPGGKHAEEALYLYARTFMRQEDYDRALEILDTYIDRYPRGGHVEDVHYYRGWLPYDHRENERAIEGFEAYLDRYGYRSGRSSLVYGFLAWTYMRMSRWEKAIETYQKMKPFGNMLVWGKALYWQAEAYRRMGDDAQALERLDRLRDRYPVTYYGVLGEQLRARIKGDDPRASEVWWPDDSGGADDSPRLKVTDQTFPALPGNVRSRWAEVKALVQLNEQEIARRHLEPIRRRLRRAVPSDERDQWVHAVGIYVRDFHEMWRRATGGSIAALPKLPDPESLRSVMAYPKAYESVVKQVAGEFSIPTYLMYAIMRQESRYSPAQISHTNAVGALQMIPSTARKVADDLGIDYRPRAFFRPEVGFRYSAFYMRKLLDTFQGKIVPMAAAYNSGPSVVAHWFDENPDASFPWLIEEFAYNEGRNYCRKVAEHLVRYLYLYESDPERRAQILNAAFPTSIDIELPDDVGY